MYEKIVEHSTSLPTFISCLFLVCLGILTHLILKRKKLNYIPCVQHRYLDVMGDLKNLQQRRPSENILCYSQYVLQLVCAYANIFRKKGIFCVWICYTPFIVFVKAQPIEELISGTRMLEKSWVYKWLHPWLGTGLLTSHGSKWKSRRRLLTPSFHFDILKDFLQVFNEQSMFLVQTLKKEAENPSIDIIMPVTLCTLDIICETTLGVSIGAQKNSESDYVKAVLRASGTFMERMVNPQFYLDFVFNSSKTGQQSRADLQLLHGFTRSVIQEKKQKLLNGSAKSSGQKRKALMDLLLEQHVENQSLTEEDIREEIDTFAFEGHDTTSMGICWALYMIGLYKDIQNKIHEELDEIFGEDRERHVTTDDLKDMKYLECVLKESQRLYPSVPVIGRQANEDITIDGYKIPKGSACMVMTYELHRDPDVFPNPEQFDPERFFPENSLGRHPYAYIPFSAGPRNCIGQRFAMMEEKTVVANILRNCCLHSLEPRDQVAPAPGLILRSAYPLKMKIRPR